MVTTDKTMSLTPSAQRILCDKATEPPHSGTYLDVARMGTYLCRRCGLALFRAHDQFHASCGWPSFDDELPHTVKQIPDVDGRRQEILCNRCDGHLGHVFLGEQFTSKNCRYCVNSASIDFVQDNTVLDTDEALLAGGCFWGVEYHLSQLPGVLKVEVGYSGGTTDSPTYEQVCAGTTGHYEVARVIFDVAKLEYKDVLKLFFEIHDPTDIHGQGPDLGPQYQSAVFYHTDAQKKEVETFISALTSKGYDVATRLLQAKPFWIAKEAHQNHHSRHGSTPSCHQRVKRFEPSSTSPEKIPQQN